MLKPGFFAVLVAMLLSTRALLAQEPQPPLEQTSRVLFLHHSTGECVWNGGVPEALERYNAAHQTRYRVEERSFPKEAPYGWENFPFDYWNIWVRHAGPRPYREEPTLEMLTRDYDVIVFKHCFPVCSIEPDTGHPDVASADKRIENYKLQYAALKAKLRKFPSQRFLLWTGAAQVSSDVDAASARRARSFFQWVVNEWDETGDNIYLWDFYALETGGGLYLKPEYASGDAHPNEGFARLVAPLFVQRIVDVIEGRGDSGSLTGGEFPASGIARRTEPVAPSPEPPAPVPVPALGEDAWVLDDAQDKQRLKQLWNDQAEYVADGDQRVVRINFAQADREDWGEYGAHRVAFTKASESNTDISAYRYLALRIRTSEAIDVVLSLRTLPKPQDDRFQPHFGFNAYFSTGETQWQWIVLDLARLELALEGGEEPYAAAGRPERPQQLTTINFAIHDRHVGAEFLIDDITFHRTLPESLKPFLADE